MSPSSYCPGKERCVSGIGDGKQSLHPAPPPTPWVMGGGLSHFLEGLYRRDLFISNQDFGWELAL